MSEEEIEAIKEIKYKLEYLKNSSIPDYNLILAIEKVLNLIDKLQKEIEETAKRQMIATTDYWKDKIRNKIKELENIEQEEIDYSRIKFATIVLEELLGDEEDDR